MRRKENGMTWNMEAWRHGKYGKYDENCECRPVSLRIVVKAGLNRQRLSETTNGPQMSKNGLNLPLSDNCWLAIFWIYPSLKILGLLLLNFPLSEIVGLLFSEFTPLWKSGFAIAEFPPLWKWWMMNLPLSDNCWFVIFWMYPSLAIFFFFELWISESDEWWIYLSLIIVG